MAQLTFNIPNDQVLRIVNSFCKKYSYPDSIIDPNQPPDVTIFIPNPQSKIEFTKQKIREFIMSNVYSVELDDARKIISINKDLNIT